MVSILECFTIEKPAWSLAELTAQLNVPKSSLHRHLLGLEHHGILRRDGEKLWRLGYRLFIWGALVPRVSTLRHIAERHLRELVHSTNESAILTMYDNHEVICIDKLESNHSVRMTLSLGTRRMPHAGASSKILMAYLPKDEIQAIIDNKGLPKLSTNTITNPGNLKADLARIRQNGYSFSQEETDTGAWGVATPIFDHIGQVVAGIGVAGPTSRFSDTLQEEYVDLCCRASERITTILRGEAPGNM
jgi:DNA-binding IclR family transcriptional regulator